MLAIVVDHRLIKGVAATCLRKSAETQLSLGRLLLWLLSYTVANNNNNNNNTFSQLIRIDVLTRRLMEFRANTSSGKFCRPPLFK